MPVADFPTFGFFSRYEMILNVPALLSLDDIVASNIQYLLMSLRRTKGIRHSGNKWLYLYFLSVPGK